LTTIMLLSLRPAVRLRLSQLVASTWSDQRGERRPSGHPLPKEESMATIWSKRLAILSTASLVLVACGDGPEPAPVRSDGPTPVTSEQPTPRGAEALHQDGLRDLRLEPHVADVSIADLEVSFPPGGAFDLRPESEHCGTARRADLGLVAVTDEATAVRAFVAEGNFTTPEGIGVGSSLEDIRMAYGNAVLAEDDTADGGLQVVIDELDEPGEEVTPETMLYIFDLGPSGEVRTLRAGPLPWLLGCTGWEYSDPGSPIELTASFFGVGELELGGTVEEAEIALGVDFGPVEPLTDAGDCGLTQDTTDGLGLVVATPGGVQAVVVAHPDIPFVQADQPVGVSSTVDEVRAAFPKWVGSDGYASLFGGERLTVTPMELPGRALLMEADENGIIRQYRVGVDRYVLHVDYCTTPE
jgi:hypothetical protein